MRARKFKHQVFIPVLGNDAYARLFLYLADFSRNRLDSFMDFVLNGWKRKPVDHILWKLYRLLKNLDTLRHGVSRFCLFSSNLL